MKKSFLLAIVLLTFTQNQIKAGDRKPGSPRDNIQKKVVKYVPIIITLAACAFSNLTPEQRDELLKRTATVTKREE